MTELYIDGQRLETNGDISVKISMSLKDIKYPLDSETDTYKFEVPATAENSRVLGFPEQILAAERFNDSEHAGKIISDGITVLEGKVRLVSSEETGNGAGKYVLQIVKPVPGWIRDSRNTLLRETGIGFEGTISGNLVQESWTNDSPVKFLAVQRDVYEEPEYEYEVAPLKIMTYEDYHPFVNIKSILGDIFGRAGYTMRSEFIDSPEFGSLYMSGYYPEKDVSILKSRMDFFAGKLSDTSAVANAQGSVYTSPYKSYSVGNIVDTADSMVSDGGYRIEKAFSNGGCFRKADERMAFIPSQDVTTGFEYRLRYVTDFTPKSATEFRGFNRIALENSSVYQLSIPNKLDGLKNGNIAVGTYTVCIFGYDAGKTYRLVVNGIPSIISQEVQNFTISPTVKSIYMQCGTGGSFTTTTEWELYDPMDYAEATQDVEVFVTLRSAPAPRRAGEPVYFDSVLFSGAAAGTPLKLLAGTSLKPIFYANPLEGSDVTFGEVFAHDKKQSILIDALRHIFNLRFLTDEEAKTVVIEPRDAFYKDTIIDWSGKTDHTKPVTSEELGSDVARSVKMLYTDDDGTVMRNNESTKTKYAAWEWKNENLFAVEKTQESVNPLFAPTINAEGGFPQARSASVMKVGDRDGAIDGKNDGNLNFGAKICRYGGMRSLPDGEIWGYPSYGRSYPFAAFHDGSGTNGFTLCFNDCEGKEGLHKHLDQELAITNSGKRITVYLYLTPADIYGLQRPEEDFASFRSKFRLKLFGEDVSCRLEKVADYDPGSYASTKCVFIKE